MELVQADTLARHHRGRGDHVRFQTGTDDNSLKNVLAAEAAGVDVQEFVDGNAAAFIALAEPLSPSVDDVIRTSRHPRHRAGVERFWRACADAGDLGSPRPRCFGHLATPLLRQLTTWVGSHAAPLPRVPGGQNRPSNQPLPATRPKRTRNPERPLPWCCGGPRPRCFGQVTILAASVAHDLGGQPRRATATGAGWAEQTLKTNSGAVNRSDRCPRIVGRSWWSMLMAGSGPFASLHPFPVEEALLHGGTPATERAAGVQ
ncbi:class I tRNA ligase family protein [Sphaerisporangium flaviroseum]|uniref:class I tRNA ligase family protein n=1 Tax=Sphaerisporangium flaviroseum TaxID=509199 RepID=UPI0031EF2E18